MCDVEERDVVYVEPLEDPFAEPAPKEPTPVEAPELEPVAS